MLHPWWDQWAVSVFTRIFWWWWWCWWDAGADRVYSWHCNNKRYLCTTKAVELGFVEFHCDFRFSVWWFDIALGYANVIYLVPLVPTHHNHIHIGFFSSEIIALWTYINGSVGWVLTKHIHGNYYYQTIIFGAIKQPNNLTLCIGLNKCLILIYYELSYFNSRSRELNRQNGKLLILWTNILDKVNDPYCSQFTSSYQYLRVYSLCCTMHRCIIVLFFLLSMFYHLFLTHLITKPLSHTLSLCIQST